VDRRVDGRVAAPFILAGAGMALVFAPSANAVLSSVRTEQTGQASGATNAIRELGGVLGIAVLATVFSSHGSYGSPQAYVNGLVPAMWVGVGVLAAGAAIAAALPFAIRSAAAVAGQPTESGESGDSGKVPAAGAQPTFDLAA
jgi:hypothetical protein